MKLWHIIGIMLVGLLFLYPGRETKVSQMQRQEQQEDSRDMRESLQRLSFEVVYHSPSLESDGLADISWLKKAADLAIAKGNPFFNIVEQKLIRSSRLKKGSGRNTVEGVIQLSPDPMEAEYDAREVRNLNLATDK